MPLSFKVSEFGGLMHSTVWQNGNSAASGHCNRKQAAPGEGAWSKRWLTFVDLIGVRHIQERAGEILNSWL